MGRGRRVDAPWSPEQAQAVRATEGIAAPTNSTQIFTEEVTGGIQHVVARDSSDEAQVRSVRHQLRSIRDAFLRGEIPAPAYGGRAGVAAIALLNTAPPGSLLVGYRDIPDGGELSYRTWDARLAAALHAWFAAQVAEPQGSAVVAHMAGPAPNSGR